MAYGLKYQTQFTSQSDANNASKDYTLQFLFKDYTGGEVSVIGAETSVIQRCTDDNPVSPIKGQSLDISLLNKNGALPISSFFSDDDDGVMVKLLQGNNVLFVGFLVQDDFYETMVDYSHPITLSATDNLGLLKGVILSEADVRRIYPMAEFQTNGVNTVVYVYVADLAFYPQAGDTLELQGVSYIVSTAVKEDTAILSVGYNWTITLTTSTGGIAPVEEDIYLTGEIDLIQRNSLLSILAVCLGQTNLSLITNIFMNLYEYTQDNTVSTFEQTILDSQLFISGETYEDCYSALTKILTAFNLTLFQANGQWNIVHWHEMRQYTNNACPSFMYDETWARLGTGVFNSNFVIGPDPQLTRPIFELRKGAMRGYKFTRKQFDYRTPKYLLKNYDLLTLGALIRQYVSGTDRISEYEATDWIVGVGPIYAEYFIRVVYDLTLLRESDRYLVVRGNCSDTIRTIACSNIEAQELDKLVFSFSTRTNFSQATYGGVFAVRLVDGTLTRYVDELPAGNGDWVPTVGFSYSFTSNTNEWTSVEIASSQIPFDGLVNCFLAQNNGGALNNSRETHYKDIRFEYIQYINDSLKIIGHIHKQDQPPNKKLNTDVEIQIDDSPRNSIVGTLFLPRLVGLLQARTTYWRYPPDANGWKLGELTTLEELRWRQETRSKLEGGFIGNYQNDTPVSLLTMIQTTFNPSKNYTFGLLTIDYKRNQFSGTLWELYDSEQDELVNTYSFTYIYEAT